MKYEVKGGNLPVLLVNLEAGETIECEAGAMSWMDEGIEMQTQGGGIGKMFGRILTNENAFVNHYTARVPGEIAFAGKFPGSIRAIRVTPQEPLYIQKGAYLCSMGRIDSRWMDLLWSMISRRVRGKSSTPVMSLPCRET